MNNILELKGNRFRQQDRTAAGGGRSMNNTTISFEKIDQLEKELSIILFFWQNEQRPFNGIILSVHYNKIAAKSNRIGALFAGKDSNDSIVGAKYNDKKTKHIITYYITEKQLETSIYKLQIAKKILEQHFNNIINRVKFEDATQMNNIPFIDYETSKSGFKGIIADVSYIERFSIEESNLEIKNSIVTIYDINLDTEKLLNELGIDDITRSSFLDNRTINLNENQLQILQNRAPYLISMGTEDISKLSPNDFHEPIEKEYTTSIPSPINEPTIGVLDTLFDEDVYFNEWVEFHDKVNPAFQRQSRDYEHGTAVTSLIVDGPRMNPWLDDGCGRFKVRHFGIALGNSFSSFTVIKSIKEIISENKDIKVWNLSLGSNDEINDNFISAEASILDEIQYENDVIFIISGTNKNREDTIKIGSPADSINSLVVNSVTNEKLPTKYSRKGLALSFFSKPDVSYYGGSTDKYIVVREPLMEAKVAGTSFASPWIARKMSYLIDVLGFSREVAKALLIDAARDWEYERTFDEITYLGHGVVPIRIEDIIQTKKDEIKFIISDISEKWNSYNYSIPVPLQNDFYPYFAKATMCYFPKCSRSQGVDYTNTELNLRFGRVNNNRLIVINDDYQNDIERKKDIKSYVFEEEARSMFRKWDNVKTVFENPEKQKRLKKSYDKKEWGIEIKTSNRLNRTDGVGVKFGLVITLKEMNGVNRIDEFIRNCHLNGWLVNVVDHDLRIEFNEKLHETIEFES